MQAGVFEQKVGGLDAYVLATLDVLPVGVPSWCDE